MLEPVWVWERRVTPRRPGRGGMRSGLRWGWYYAKGVAPHGLVIGEPWHWIAVMTWREFWRGYRWGRR